MERPPELKRMRASSLSPELYGEISEFFSSVHPDFAMSGKTSLHVLYERLQKAKAKKNISAKQLKKAEEMIRALCAAAEVGRRVQFKAHPGVEKPDERRLRLVNLAGKPREFEIEAKKRAVIDFAAKKFFGGHIPELLDYKKNPAVLQLEFREIADRIGISRKVRAAGPSMEWPETAKGMERFAEPRELARLLERIGFQPYMRNEENVYYGRVRDGEPYIMVVNMRQGFRYKPLAFVEIMVQAGVTPAEFRAHAGALK